MEARRTAGQVVAAARAMDAARAAGLPDGLLTVLLQAREAWWVGGPWPSPVHLVEAINHPAARLVDQTLIAAIRRHLKA